MIFNVSLGHQQSFSPDLSSSQKGHDMLEIFYIPDTFLVMAKLFLAMSHSIAFTIVKFSGQRFSAKFSNSVFSIKNYDFILSTDLKFLQIFFRINLRKVLFLKKKKRLRLRSQRPKKSLVHMLFCRDLWLYHKNPGGQIQQLEGDIEFRKFSAWPKSRNKLP